MLPILMCGLVVLLPTEDVIRGAVCRSATAWGVSRVQPALGERHRVRSCPLRCRATAAQGKAAVLGSCEARPVLRSIEKANSLAEDGIVRVPVDLAAVEEMRGIFQHLRETTGNQFRRCAPAWGSVSRSGARDNIMWTEEIPCSVEASNFRLADGLDEVYDVYTTGFAPTMRWVAVGDKGTLDRWHAALGHSIQGQLEEALDQRLVLCQACFVVVHGGVREGDAKLHADWAMEAIPRGEVFTALTPLSDFPDDVGGLIVDVNSMPKREEMHKGSASWSREKDEILHRYQRGEAVVFDGKLMHRTQPFANPDFERVLASFSFCTAAAHEGAYLPELLQVLGDQTPAFYVSPGGEARGEAQTKLPSYSAARRAVQRAGVRDYHTFWHWSRSAGRSMRVPVHPHKAYCGRGWVSWDHFFDRSA